MAGHINDMVSQHWNTPQYIVDAVRTVFPRLDFDPCDNEFSTTGATFHCYLPENDGLKMPWFNEDIGIETIFCNPPYGRDKERKTSIADWVKKSYDESVLGANVILLIPAATEATFWFKYIWPYFKHICFVKGRVKFPIEGRGTGASTKGSAIILFSSDEEIASRFKNTFEKLGYVL